MKKTFIDAVAVCGFVEGKTLFLHGTMNPEESYPDTFVTFTTNDVADNVHFDNAAVTADWSFTLILYSNNPAIVNEKPKEIIAALKAAGFILQSKGQDVPSDEPTHTGWAMDFIISATE